MTDFNNPFQPGQLVPLTDAILPDVLPTLVGSFTFIFRSFQQPWVTAPVHLCERFGDYVSVSFRYNGQSLSSLCVRLDGRTVWRNVGLDSQLINIVRAPPLSDFNIFVSSPISRLVLPHPQAPPLEAPLAIPPSFSWPHLKLRVNDQVVTLRGYINIGPRSTDWWVSIATRGQDMMLQLGSGPVVLHAAASTSPYRLSLFPVDYLQASYFFSNNFRVLLC